MNEAAMPPPEKSPAFSLLDEPWLPVQWAAGSTSPVGLRELFRQSHAITGIVEPSAPAFVALHRLLLALTHRALTLELGQWRDEDRARWYREGLPQQAFERYFDKWHGRFWLFHPTAPFMQVAELSVHPNTRAAKPWTVVSMESASGNNPVLFDHSVDTGPTTVSVAQALRAMLGMLQFTAGGPVKVLRNKAGENGHGRMGPLCDSAAVLPVGGNLAQTLLLGLHPSPRSAQERDEDLPAWERPPLTVADLKPETSLPTGPNDRYTRQVRGMLLSGGNCAGLVSHIHYCEGQDLESDALSVDPMHAFRLAKDAAVRLRFVEGRAVWRDLPALLPEAEGSGWRAAAAVNWALQLLSASGNFDEAAELVVAGTAADKGKMLATRTERFSLPAGAMTSAENSAALREQLKRAEELFTDVKSLAVLMWARSRPDPQHPDSRKLARTSVEQSPLAAIYFARCGQGLPALLRHVGAGDVAAAYAAWSATLLDAARLAWNTLGHLLGPSAAAMKSRALTEGAFFALVKPLWPESAPAEANGPHESAKEEVLP